MAKPNHKLLMNLLEPTHSHFEPQYILVYIYNYIYEYVQQRFGHVLSRNHPSKCFLSSQDGTGGQISSVNLERLNLKSWASWEFLEMQAATQAATEEDKASCSSKSSAAM